MKYIFGVVVVSCLSAGVLCYSKTACGDGPSHNLVLGNRTYGDRLLFSGTEHIDSAMLRVKTYDFHWPLHGTSHETVTKIEVIDKMKDGSGGCAFLTGGGPGAREVKLHLKTQRGNSADFHISIFGK